MLGGVYFLLLAEALLLLLVLGVGVFFFACGGAFAEPEFIRLVGGIAGVVLRGAGAVS